MTRHSRFVVTTTVRIQTFINNYIDYHLLLFVKLYDPTAAFALIACVSVCVSLFLYRTVPYRICFKILLVLPTMDLQVNKNNDKSWIWNCPADYSEDPQKPSADVYAIRFNSADGMFLTLSFDSNILLSCCIY